MLKQFCRVWKQTLFILLFPSFAFSGAGLTYHGRITKPDGTALDSASVDFKIEIRSPGSNNCLMYQEQQTQAVTNGVFNLNIADGTVAPSFSVGTIDQVLSNAATFTFTGASGCTVTNSYNPSSGDGRNIKVYFKESIAATWEAMPLMTVNYVPYAKQAMQAEKVGIHTPASLLRVENSGAPSNATALTPANFTELMALILGTSTQYEKVGKLNGVSLPTMASGDVLGWNGSSWVASNPTSGMVSSVVGTSGDITVSTVGAVATVDLATVSGLTTGTYGSANQVPQVTVDAKGRVTNVANVTITGVTPGGAASGDLTGTYPGPTIAVGAVTSAKILDGTITGADLNSGINISTSGDITAHNVTATNNIVASNNVAANSVSTRTVAVSNAGNNTLSLTVPSAAFSNFALVLPSGDGTIGQVLKTDGSGNLYWGAGTSGSVTSVGANAPLSSTGGATPTLSIARSTAAVDGYLASTDFATFSNKLSTALASAKIWVGSAGGAATAVDLSGDATIANTGAMTIAPQAVSYSKIQNVSATNRILGRATAGAGMVEEITLGSGLSLSGTTLSIGSGLGTVTSVTGTSPVQVATGTTTPVISMARSTAAVDGYLASTDFATFSNKLSTALASAKMWLGSAGGAATAVDMSGDATIANTGVVTIQPKAVTLAKMNDMSTNSILGRSTAGTGVPEVISVGAGLSLSGGTLQLAGGAGAITSVNVTAPIASTGGATPTLSIARSTAAVDGYLASSDFATFSNKLSTALASAKIWVGSGGGAAAAVDLSGDATIANTGAMTIAPQAVSYSKIQNVSATNRILGRATAGAGVVEEITLGSGLSLSGTTLSIGSGLGTVTSVTGTLPVQVATGTTTPVISMAKSTAAVDGYLASTDFATFSNKLSTALASAKMWVGSAGGAATAVDLSGDVSVANTGVVTIANKAVTLAKMNDMATASILGRSTAGTGAPEVITVGAGLSISGGTLQLAGGAGAITAINVNSPISSTGGATPTLSIARSTAAVDGYLASTDFAMFSNKLSTALASAKIWVGSGGGAATAVDLSGDATIANTGAMTIAPQAVSYSKIQNVSATNRILGRATAGAGVVEEITLGSGLSLSGTTLSIGAGLGTVTNVTGTAPVQVATGSTTPVVSMARSTAAVDGYLASTDFATFSNKLSTALASAKIWVGSGGGAAAPVDISGDASIANTGVLTIANKAVTLAKMNDMATASLIGRATAGTGAPEVITIGSGLSLSGTTLQLGSGLSSQWTTTGTDIYYNTGRVGVGTSSPQAGFVVSGDATIGKTTANLGGAKLDVKGAFVMSGATSGYNGFQVPAIAGATIWTLPSIDGSSGQVLKTNGSGVLSWVSQSSGGTASGTSGEIQYSDGAGGFTSNSVFKFTNGGTTGTVTLQGGGRQIEIDSTASMDIRLKNNTSPNYNPTLTFEHYTVNAVSDVLGNINFNRNPAGTALPAGVISVVNEELDATTTKSGARMTFSTTPVGSAAVAERMRITPAGNVGIGTTTPNAVLAVSGDMTVGKTSAANGSAKLDVAGPIVMSGSTSGYNGFKAAAVAGSTVWTLPSVDGTSGQVLQTNGSGVLAWATASGGGGLTNFTEAVNTSSPNTTVPVVSLTANNGATNVSVAIARKGAGAIMSQVSDGTVTGGNKRGQRALDFQVVRSSASQVASGDDSIILGGSSNVASGPWSTVLNGVQGTASAQYSTVVNGYLNTASSTYAFVNGYRNGASGSGSSVLNGSDSSAVGANSTVINGDNAVATGAFSVASGPYSTADSYNQYTFGQYNLPKGSETAASWVATDPLFVLGNGTGGGASRSNALMILKNGKVGIGNTVPTAYLTVSGDATIGKSTAANGGAKLDIAGALAFSGSSSGYTGFQAAATSGSTIYTLPSTDGSSGQVLQTNGSGVLSWAAAGGGGGGDFYKNGTVAMTGQFQAYSGDYTAPGIAFANDLNTGMFDPSGDTIALTTNGTERLRILSSGYVGIGTTVPGSPLHVGTTASLSWTTPIIKATSIGSSGTSYVGVDSATSTQEVGFSWAQGGSAKWANYMSGSGNELHWYYGGDKMLLTSTGRLGIGVASPTATLSVSGDATIGKTTNINGGAKLDVAGAIVMSGSTSGYNGFRVPATAGATIWTLPSVDGTSGQVLKTDGAGVLSWATAGGGSQWTTTGSDIYYNTGKVGIGTTSPASTLNVATAPTATADYGVVSLGDGAWDGAAAGHYVSSNGNTNGTVLAINSTSGFTGNLLDVQKGGSSKFFVGSTGIAVAEYLISSNYVAANNGLFTSSTNSNENTLVLQGGSGIGNYAPAAGINAGIQSRVQFNPSSGTATFNATDIAPTANTTGTYAGDFTALRVSPYLQSTTGIANNNLLDLGTNSAANGAGTHTSKFIVTSGGLVGIGMVPTKVLDITGSSASVYSTSGVPVSPTNIRITNSNTTNNNASSIGFGATESGGSVVTGASITQVITSHTNSAVSADLAFQNRFAGTYGETMRITASGDVGIGTTAPQAKLDVNGSIRSVASSNGSTTIDFQTGNLQYTSSNCGGLTLKNLKSGGTYSLAVQGAGGGTCSITNAYSDAGLTSLTVKVGGSNMVQTAGNHMILTFMVMGSYVYVATVTNY